MNKFNQIATARRRDPVSSYAAADRLNADNCKKLNKQLTAVLRAIESNPGGTAKELGIILAAEKGDFELLGWPHRRMPQLVDKGYVKRVSQKKDFAPFVCYITAAGRKALNDSS